MPRDIQKTAFITGAGRGLGLSCARGLIKRGYKVVIAARETEALERAASFLAEDGGDVLQFQLDITNREHIASLTEVIQSNELQVDVLINNAGIMLEGRSTLSQLESKTFKRTLEVNLLGPTEIMQIVVPKMVERGWGRVVNVSSEMGAFSAFRPYAPAYRISKAALNAATRLASLEWSGRGILINAVCPGWIRTELGGENAPRSVEQGADSVIWAVELPDGGPSGGFFRDGLELEF
jgi:NAD(P)-dependent dehydrogenase (short-subunit alcohol dehydrogenase family)